MILKSSRAIHGVQAKDLQASPYHDAEQQIDLLSDLPRIISSSSTNGVLFSQLIGLLLRGIARADGVALVKSSRLSEDPDGEIIIEVMGIVVEGVGIVVEGMGMVIKAWESSSRAW